MDLDEGIKRFKISTGTPGTKGVPNIANTPGARHEKCILHGQIITTTCGFSALMHQFP